MPRSRTLLYAFLAMLALASLTGVGPARADGFGGTVTQGAQPTVQERPCSTCPGKPSLVASRARGGIGDPVWTYDGSLQLSYTDLVVGRNFPITITRSYDSRSEYDRTVGWASRPPNETTSPRIARKLWSG